MERVSRIFKTFVCVSKNVYRRQTSRGAKRRTIVLRGTVSFVAGCHGNPTTAGAGARAQGRAVAKSIKRTAGST